MCCSGGAVAASDIALQKAQAAQVTQQNNDYNTTFAEQQGILNAQTARLNYVAANPMGYTPQQLASATTSINENTATAAKQAIGAAASFASSHGGADIGSGATGSLAGEIASSATLSKAGQLADVSRQNQSMKQQNFWTAINGLSNTGAEYGGAGSTAIGGSGNLGNDSVNAGSGALAAQQASWGNVMGVVKGVAGLGTAGVDAFNSLQS